MFREGNRKLSDRFPLTFLFLGGSRPLKAVATLRSRPVNLTESTLQASPECGLLCDHLGIGLKP